MNYCGKHGIHHESSECPRCEMEERHQELVDQAREGVEQAREDTESIVSAMRESEYRRANPGDYACPHCLYISLKMGASRCPLCHGDLPNDHWVRVRASEKAKAELRRAEEKAAEERKRAAELAVAAEVERNGPALVAAAKAERKARAKAAARKSIPHICGEFARNFVFFFGLYL